MRVLAATMSERNSFARWEGRTMPVARRAIAYPFWGEMRVVREGVGRVGWGRGDAPTLSAGVRWVQAAGVRVTV